MKCRYLICSFRSLVIELLIFYLQFCMFQCLFKFSFCFYSCIQRAPMQRYLIGLPCINKGYIDLYSKFIVSINQLMINQIYKTSENTEKISKNHNFPEVKVMSSYCFVWPKNKRGSILWYKTGKFYFFNKKAGTSC